MVEGISPAKCVWFHTSSTKLCIHENCIIVLPVIILMGVGCQLLGPHDILPCVLIHLATFLVTYEEGFTETCRIIIECTKWYGYIDNKKHKRNASVMSHNLQHNRENPP